MQWTIWERDPFTGVTLQTLDLEHFDKGHILMQSELIKLEQNESFDSLLVKLAPIGADLLAKAITKISKSADLIAQSSGASILNPAEFLLPLFESTSKSAFEQQFSHAPKVDNKKRQIRWDNSPLVDIERQARAFGTPLWTNIVSRRKRDGELLTRRVHIDGIRDVSTEIKELLPNPPKVVGEYVKATEKLRAFFPGIFVRTFDGHVIHASMKSETYNKTERRDSRVFDNIFHLDRERAAQAASRPPRHYPSRPRSTSL